MRRFSACEDLPGICIRRPSGNRNYSADGNCLVYKSTIQVQFWQQTLTVKFKKKRNQVILLRHLIHSDKLCSFSTRLHYHNCAEQRFLHVKKKVQKFYTFFLWKFSSILSKTLIFRFRNDFYSQLFCFYTLTGCTVFVTDKV